MSSPLLIVAAIAGVAWLWQGLKKQPPTQETADQAAEQATYVPIPQFEAEQAATQEVQEQQPSYEATHSSTTSSAQTNPPPKDSDDTQTVAEYQAAQNAQEEHYEAPGGGHPATGRAPGPTPSQIAAELNQDNQATNTYAQASRARG